MAVCMDSLPLKVKKPVHINKPWRIAYLNPSLGTRPNEKCDGSHIHIPCPGQNTSNTEGYTPKIVRIVHECFRDDVRSGKFDVPTYTSAAVHMHNNPILIAAVPRLNPALSIGAQNRANYGKLDRHTKRDSMDEADRAAAGDDSTEAGEDASAAAGDDARVVAIWTGDAVLDKARFIPDLESKMTLLTTVESMENDKALYEWLKNVIYLCEFIVPSIKFYYIKMGTITMIARMLDPDQICGVDVERTMSLRRRCTHASILFGNVAGELLCTWATTSIDNDNWVPASWRGDEETLPSFVSFKDVPWMLETSDDLGQVSYDKEGHVLCQEHSVSQPAQDCPWCQYRRRSFVEQAKKTSPDYDKPDAVATIVYEPPPAPDVIPMDEEGWGVQVGHEGARLDLKGQYGPLARWGINLREHYSYLMLPHNPDEFTDSPEMKDWTDSRFIDELREEQEKGYVNTGLIPAAVYKAAIEHYSFKPLHNNLMLEDEGNDINLNVEKYALRPMLTDPTVLGTVECWPQKVIRNSTILFLGDSGMFMYKSTSNMKVHDSVDEFLRGAKDGNWTTVKSRWHNLNGVHGCGAGWADWIEGMHIVTKKAMKDSILEFDPDGQERFPSWYHVACFDNNSLDANTPEEETKRLKAKKPTSRKPRTTYNGFMENGLLQSELNELMKCLGKFKSCVYVRTAPASRWSLPLEVDKISDEIVNRATENKVTCIRGEWFWSSFVKFATPKSARWHHAHAQGNDRFLHHHRDRMLLRVISFSKACTIHPGTPGSICDHKAYEKLYEEIKREEVLDHPPQQGDSSSSRIHVDTKVEDLLRTLCPRALPTVSLSESLMVRKALSLLKGVGLITYASEKEENEDQTEEDLPDEEEPLGSEEEALRNEEVVRSRLDKLNKVTETLMSNLQKTARDHLQSCRSDFQFRRAHPDPNAPKGAGRIVHHMNDTFGPDHKALEGFS